MARGKRATEEKKRPAARPDGRPAVSFSRVNALWLGGAAVAIGVGYALLAGGSTTVAALLLVVGYVVLLPIGIIKK